MGDAVYTDAEVALVADAVRFYLPEGLNAPVFNLHADEQAARTAKRVLDRLVAAGWRSSVGAAEVDAAVAAALRREADQLDTLATAVAGLAVRIGPWARMAR